MQKITIQKARTTDLEKLLAFELRLDVYNENASAIKTYEKAGFKKHSINRRIGL